MREIGCSLATEDYSWPARHTAEFVLERVQPGDIVDLHDGRPALDGPADSSPTREATVEAVGAILAGMAGRGLRSVTVSELLSAS